MPSYGSWLFLSWAMLTLVLLSSQIELIMEAIHKNRNLQYKKTMEVMQAYCCLLPYGLMLLKYTSMQPYLHLICLLTHSCSIWCLSKAKRLYEQRCRDKDEAEQAVHRNANLVTQKQQEKVRIVAGCATWERSVSSHRFPIPCPSLSSGVRMAWVGCWPSLVGLLCCEWSTRALLYLSSLSHLWQLFLKLAQTKSALEDSGECGDTAYWFGGGRGISWDGRREKEAEL